MTMPNCFSGFDIDDEFVFGRRLHRQIGGILALENSIDIAGGAPELVDEIGPIGDQAAAGDVEAGVEDRRQPVPERQRDDQLAMDRRRRAPVTIRPPLGSCANAVMSRSISPASRRSIGRNSTPSDGATAWIAPNWPGPAGHGRIRAEPPTRFTFGAISLSSSSHFPPMRIFEVGEARDVAARPRQAIDVTCADRIGDKREHDRNGTARLQQRRDGRAGMGQDDVGGERDQFRRVLAHVVGIAGAPAVIDPEVVADGPTRLLKALRERREAGLRFRIVRRETHQHADPPHARRPVARARPTTMHRPRRTPPRRREA